MNQRTRVWMTPQFVFNEQVAGIAPNAYIKNFSIGANTGAGIDSVSQTDGMTNLFEYALGKEPNVSDQLASNIEAGVITFTKGAAVNDDVTYTIEESDDLGVFDPWEPLAPNVNDDIEISYTLPLGRDAFFVRLKVTLAP